MTMFKLHQEPLQDAWLDAYGHLNEAYYLVPMSNATWKLQGQFGIGTDYFDETGCALYTVETHLRYLNDVRPPAVIAVESMILDADAKRIWFAHQLLVDRQLRATGEFVVLHYDTCQRRTTTMPEDVQAQLRNAQVATLPDWVGRRCGLNQG